MKLHQITNSLHTIQDDFIRGVQLGQSKVGWFGVGKIGLMYSVPPGLIAAGIVSAWTWAATLLQSSATA